MEVFYIVLVVLITLAFAGFSTIGIIKGITNFRLRKRLIDAGLVNEDAMQLVKEGGKENYYVNLK